MRSEAGSAIASPNNAEHLLTIDGVGGFRVEHPSAGPDVSEILADAAARGLAVAPVGGGTALGLGNLPERLDCVVSTARLNGILAYEPADLTLSVGAGAYFAGVQALLSEHGQELPLDVAIPEKATIGGLIATGLAGPRRLGSGTLRDLLIGIAVAHPSGTVTKAGGMVVKNVTGFDLPRLYHGSLGTLGIIISANFKILPVARFESSVLTTFPTLDVALESAKNVRASRLQPLALEVTGEGANGPWLVAVRLAGREQSVNLLAAEARTFLGGDAETRSGVESQAWWKDYTRKQAVDHGATDVFLRCTSRPSATATMTHMAMTTIAQHGELVRCDVSPGLGAVLIRVDLGISGGVQVLAALRNDLLCRAERVTVLAAPSPWKVGLDVWGPPPPGFDVMRSLKEEFDPHRVLNPGRFAGFL